MRILIYCGVLGFCAEGRAESVPLASQSAQPFRVVLRSSTACTDSNEFINKLRSRTSGLRPARSEEKALSFQVDLVPTSSGVRGQLQVQELDGTLAVRVIPASDCHEVLSAMALIAALMVDPFARDAPTFGPMPPGPVSDGLVSEAAPRPTPGGLPPFDFGFGQRLSSQAGVLPGLSLGFSLFLDLGYRFSDLVHPSLRIAGMYAAKSVRKREAEAAFTWASARLSVCPVRFGWSGWLQIRPCAFWDSGSLGAEGLGTDRPEATSIFWAATGLALDAEARLAGPLTLGGEVGALFPLVRDRFYFDPDGPDDTVHTVPAAGWSAALGLGLRFY